MWWMSGRAPTHCDPTSGDGAQAVCAREHPKRGGPGTGGRGALSEGDGGVAAGGRRVADRKRRGAVRAR